MKIAAAQMICAVADLRANVRKMREFAARAKENGASLLVFPETADLGYAMEVIREQAQPWDSGAVPELQKMAREFSLAMVCGISERDGEQVYNTQAVIGADGELLGKYRKTHLFSLPPAAEDKYFARGDCLAGFSLGEFRCGLSICYDLRFPEVFRHLAMREKANVFIISSAWPFPRAEHLRILALARAIENQSYMLVANRAGRDGNITFSGGSAIIDPYGVLLAAASADREELVVAEISSAVLEAVRTKIPVFADRRSELYG